MATPSPVHSLVAYAPRPLGQKAAAWTSYRAAGHLTEDQLHRVRISSSMPMYVCVCVMAGMAAEALKMTSPNVTRRRMFRRKHVYSFSIREREHPLGVTTIYARFQSGDHVPVLWQKWCGKTRPAIVLHTPVLFQMTRTQIGPKIFSLGWCIHKIYFP